MNARVAAILKKQAEKRQECIAKQICVKCSGPAVVFKDPQSHTDYTQTTGWCQECQDKEYGA